MAGRCWILSAATSGPGTHGPIPRFPYYLNVWSDGNNWPYGHWVQGKFGVVELADLIKHICAQVGFTAD
jgi:hypothetical protein